MSMSMKVSNEKKMSGPPQSIPTVNSDTCHCIAAEVRNHNKAEVDMESSDIRGSDGEPPAQRLSHEVGALAAQVLRSLHCRDQICCSRHVLGRDRHPLPRQSRQQLCHPKQCAMPHLRQSSLAFFAGGCRSTWMLLELNASRAFIRVYIPSDRSGLRGK